MAIKKSILKNVGLILIFILITGTTYSQNKNINEIDMVFISEIFPETDINDLKISFELWVTELFQQAGLNYKVNLVLLSSEKYLNKEYDQDRTYMIVLSSIDYLKSRKGRILKPLFTSANKDISTFLLVSEKEISNLNQLQNSRMVLAERGLGIIGAFWMNCFILENLSNGSNNIFSSINYMPSESKCLTSIYFDDADVCVVSDKAFQTALELNPQLNNKLNVLAKSDKLLHNLCCLTDKFRTAEITKLKDAAFDLENTTRGKQLLNLFKLNRLRTFNDDDLIGIQKLYQNSYELKQGK